MNPHISVNHEVYLWYMGMKATLRGKKDFAALTTDDVDPDYTGGALPLIVSSLRDNPLRAVQSWSTAKDAWKKSQLRYAGKHW